MRAAIEWYDPRFMNHLVSNDDVSRRLHDLIPKVIEGRQHARNRTARDTPAVNVKVQPGVEYNYAYFPLVFESDNDVLKAMKELKKIEVLPRRYFYPSLNNLPFLEKQDCPVAESIAKRVICLPLFHDLKERDQLNIVEAIYQSQKALI